MNAEEIEEKYDAMTLCGDPEHCKDSFPDNMFGNCDGCGKPIVYRPHSPHGPNIFMACLGCGLKLMMEMKAAGEEPICVVTPKTEEEIEDYIAQTRK